MIKYVKWFVWNGVSTYVIGSFCLYISDTFFSGAAAGITIMSVNNLMYEFFIKKA